MKLFIAFLLMCSYSVGHSQVLKELQPELGFTINLTAKGRDSIKQRALLYKSALEKSNAKKPLSIKEQDLLTGEGADDASLDVFLERDCYYYVGPGYGCNYYENGGPDSIWASSAISKNYSADYLLDETLDSAWAVSGDTVGQWISFRMISNAWDLETITIYNGYQKDIGLWKRNNRVKQLLLYVDGVPRAKLNLKDVTNAQSFNVKQWFKERGKPYFIKLEIVSIYKGEKHDDTVISEITFDGPVRH